MKKIYFILAAACFTFSANAQVVLSSSFESWTGQDPDGWKGAKTNMADDSIIQVTGSSDYGNVSVRLVNQTSTHKRFTSLPLAVTSGQAFEIKFWAKGQGDIRTGIFDNANYSTTFGYHYNSYISVNSSSYTMYTQNITADTSWSAAEFIFSLRNTSAAGNHIQIDSVVISIATVPLISIYDIQYSTATPANSPYMGQSVFTGGIVTATYASGYFLQSGTGAYNGVHVFDNTNTPAIGDSITFSAAVSEYFEMTQLASVANYAVVTSGNTLPAPVVISSAAVNTEPYEGVLVRVDNANCVNANAGFGMWTINDGTTDAKVHNLIFQASPVLNNVYTVIGPVYYAFSEFRIEPRDANDVIMTGFNDVSEIHNDDLLITPNPATENIYISGISETTNIEILDLNGKIIFSVISDGSGLVSLEGIEKGIYFVRIIEKENVRISRFIKL
jgi:hypothetical protein